MIDVAGRAANRGILFLVTLVSITVLGPLAVHMYLPLMPMIQKAMGTSAAMAQLTFSLVMLVVAVGTLFYGSLSDRFGRKRVLLWGLVVFAVGSAVCVVAESIGVLLAGRLLQAAGAGSGVVLARAIARDVYGPDRLAQVIAYITVAYVLGPMFAPPIGGALADLWGWASVFVFATLVSAVVFWLVAAVLSETQDRSAGTGARLSLPASYGRLLRSPVFVGYALNPALSTGTFFAVASGSSFMMSDYYHRPASEFGLYFMLMPLGFMVGNYVSGRIGNRIGIPAMVLGGNLMALGVIVLMAVALHLVGDQPIWLFVFGGLLAVAQGISMPQAQAAAINVDKDLIGTASGIVVFLHFSGSAATSQLVGSLHDGTFVPIIAVAFAAGVLTLLSGVYANSHARRSEVRAAPAGE